MAAQYVIGKGGGNAIPLQPGMTRFAVVGTTIESYVTTGSTVTTQGIGGFQDNATALAALANLIAAIDPEAVKVS